MRTELAGPTASWNLASDLSQLLEYHFMVNALLAGSVAAVTAGLLGWLMLVRHETFAGHTLAVMAFPGASGAALLGAPAAAGYYAFCGAGALALGSSTQARQGSFRQRSAWIGSVQALALAAGFLFVSAYGGVLGDLEGLLFGNLLGIADGQLVALAALAALTLALLLAIGRPLLFASIDPDAASARGVPVRALASAFLLLLGIAVGSISQITGVLLVFSLLVAPAASAQALTPRPVLSLALTVVLGLLVVWLGLGIAYFSVYPPGFFVASVSFAIYVLARASAALLPRRASDEGDERTLDVQPDELVA
ncbi:MAG: metal ABC transporter permease [Actinobacteria bacterium]|nr:MAG: metal ABC transporter permease [Actinomycetota bacterium]